MDRPQGGPGSQWRPFLTPPSSGAWVDPAGGDAAALLPPLPLVQGWDVPPPPEEGGYRRIVGAEGTSGKLAPSCLDAELPVHCTFTGAWPADRVY